MKLYLSLTRQHNKLDTAIADTIKEYYPIALNPQSPEYNAHLGIKKINEAVSEHMNDYKEFIKPWKSFIKKLHKRADKKVHDTSYALALCYSADLILEKYEDSSMVRIKRIAFSVSLLGPFFSVCGVDETIIKEKGSKFGQGYHAINIITVSPYKEFEGCFKLVKNKIEKHFEGYKFVPFWVCARYVKDLHIPYTSGPECTVYNALFNNLLDHYYRDAFRGDTSYGSEVNDTIDTPELLLVHQ